MAEEATPTTEAPPAETQGGEAGESSTDWTASVPEKYRGFTPEQAAVELAKGYGELEKKLGERQVQDGLTIGPDKPRPVAESITDVVKAAGLKVTDLEKHYLEHGSLSEDHYEAFKKTGLGKQIVDELITSRERGKKQQLEVIRSAMADEVGGSQELDVLLARAKSLPEDVRQSYNVLISANGAGPAQARHAINILRAAIGDSTTGKPADPSSAPATGRTQPGFKTRAEWSAATQTISRAQDKGQADTREIRELRERVRATPEAIKRG